MTRWPRSRSSAAAWALWLSLAGLSVLTLGWVGFAVVRGGVLSHESGVMTGLAMDAVAGQFYPPLVAPDGYGGTRYGPGHILLQAGLIRAGLGPVVAGQVLTLIAGAAVWAGMARVLRLAAVPRAAAAGLPLLVFASPATREALSSVRPDLLPAALNVWGLACVAAVRPRVTQDLAPPPRTDRLLVAAGVLFSLALLVKITAGFGLLSAAVLLASGRRPWRGLVLVAATGVVVGLGMIACDAASGGRMWENFRACADPGGRGPVHVADWLATLREVLVTDDWLGSLLVVLAGAVWVAGPSSLRLGPAGVYLVVTLGLTLPMYFTPGLSTNHLIDLHVAAALVIGTRLAAGRPSTPADAPWGWAAATAVVVLLAVGQLGRRVELSRARFWRADAYRGAVAMAGPTAAAGPILSDNAMVPVAAGQRPFLLDDFMFPAVRHARPAVQADLYRRLDARFFTAVVLRYDPDRGDRAWVFGNRFAADLHAHYDLVGRTTIWDHLWIYRPKPN